MGAVAYLRSTRKFKVFFLALALVTGGIFATGVTHVSAQFDPLESVCTGDNSESVACNENELGQGEENPITTTTQNVVNILSLAMAVIAVVIIVVAGITMTLSQGDSGKIKSSRDAIIYAAVGLIVAALSRAIVFFIVNRTR